MQRISIYMMLCILTLNSCTKKLFTHDEVLNSFKSPKDLIARFGEPSEIRVEGKQTEYYYYYLIESNKIPHKKLDIDDPLSKNHSRAFMNYYGRPDKFVDSVNQPKNIDIKERRSYNKYMKFVFSEDQKLINTEAINLDVTVRAPAPIKTILCVFVVPVSVVLIVAALWGGPFVTLGGLHG
jgi:hypothetical protein